MLSVPLFTWIIQEEPPAQRYEPVVQETEETYEEQEPPVQSPKGGGGLKAIAMYDYEASK